MATHTFTLNGDQIGTYASLSGNGNGPERVITLTGVSPIGTISDSYTVVVTQVNEGVTEFENGQWITIYDSLGNVVMSTTQVQPDIEAGLGAGDEHLLLVNGWMIDLNGLAAFGGTVQYDIADEAADGTLGDNDGNFDFGEIESFPCFAEGTLIDTPDGPRPVEALAAGDLLLTADKGPMPISWIGARLVHLTRSGGDLPPVLVARGALDGDMPGRDLILSPQHRVLLHLPDGRAVLAPVRQLVGRSGIRYMRGRRKIRYFSILMPSHQVLTANGALCESFYPGDYMLPRMSRQNRAAILKLFPMLVFGVSYGYGPAARQFLHMQSGGETLAALAALAANRGNDRSESLIRAASR